MIALPVMALALCLPPQDATALPRPLEMLFKSRGALASGEVVWTLTEQTSEETGPERTLRFVNLYARNGDMIFEQRGDDQGWVQFRPGGKPVHRFPLLWLINQDGVMQHAETDVIGKLWTAGRDVASQDPRSLMFAQQIYDIRVAGAAPGGVGVLTTPVTEIDSLAPRSADGVRVHWRAGANGRVHRVSAEVETRERREAAQDRWEWEVDESRGWNPVSVKRWARGVLYWEVDNDLQEFDKVWFPARTRIRREGKPVAEIVVRQARFNDPASAAYFTGDHIGMESGFPVFPQNFRLPDAGDGFMRWTYEGLVDAKSFDEGRKSGRYDYSETFNAFMRGDYESPYPTDEQRRQRQQKRREMQLSSDTRAVLSDWEQYVARFCRQYNLTPEQREKAFQILRDCQEVAARYLDRSRDESRRLLSELAEARRSGDAQRVGTAKQRLDGFLTPVDEILENRLKPRLLTIPTAQQVKTAADANTPAATQPAPERSKTP